MENNETQEVQPDLNEQETTPESETNGAEDTKDWKSEALKYKAIAERKDKKLQEQPKEAEIKETNPDTGGLTRDETIFIAQGGTEEELDVLNKIKGDGTLKEAQETDLYKSYKAEQDRKRESESAQLGASGSSPTGSEKKGKSPGQMTDDEHQKFFREKMNS